MRWPATRPPTSCLPRWAGTIGVASTDWLINALEDGRIERYLGALAPWAWADFLELGALVWQQYALPDGRAERLLSVCPLHRWDVLRPKKAAARVVFAHASDRALWEGRDPAAGRARAWLVTDTEDVVVIASEILKLIGIPETASAPRGCPTRGQRHYRRARGGRPAADRGQPVGRSPAHRPTIRRPNGRTASRAPTRRGSTSI